MSTQIFDVATMPCRALVSYYCADSLLPKGPCEAVTCFVLTDLLNGKVSIVSYVGIEGDLASYTLCQIECKLNKVQLTGHKT